ncbi:MAG: aminomethyl-transferring glycine dehydrogenase subunit GcvPA [bacterium]
MAKKISAHPYIPNSVPEIKEQMLKEIGVDSADEIFAQIPEHLRFKGKLNIPGPLLSEYQLKKHVESILAKNKHCEEYTSFLGGGCWQHYVPAVVKTIMDRDEFLSAYVGDPYADHGKFQAQFEFASCIAELVDMDAVNTPTYDWAIAAGTTLRMAARITGRSEALICGAVSPERLSCMKTYAYSVVPELKLVNFDAKTGLIDLEDLKAKLSEKTAAVYFENPNFFGVIETQGEEIARLAHEKGAVVGVGVDPTSLGILEPPARYGADIVCGDVQPLGIPMSYGGGLGGFVATRDEPEYVAEFPSLLFGLTTTTEPGEYGFGEVLYERTSYASRDKAKDFLGTMAQLHGIGAGVYLALLGPEGMKELGEGMVQRAAYAQKVLSGVKGVKAPLFTGAHFKEFVVNFDGTGKTVAQVNKKLLEYKIFGGKDLSQDFPALGQSALYCVTEIHTKADIDNLAAALGEILGTAGQGCCCCP